MSMKRLLMLVSVTALLTVVGVSALAAQEAQETPEAQAAPELPGTLQFEVAEDGTRFVFSQERLFEDGMPQYGTPFVTQGYIYPVGTLNGTNGVLPTGEPEFPDQVIGEWTCYGWMIGDGGHTTTGVWVISTQVYQFNEKFDNATIVTDGVEVVDLNVPTSRAITGGTGQYAGASGEQWQTLLGFTQEMGVNLAVSFDFEA